MKSSFFSIPLFLFFLLSLSPCIFENPGFSIGRFLDLKHFLNDVFPSVSPCERAEQGHHVLRGDGAVPEDCSLCKEGREKQQKKYFSNRILNLSFHEIIIPIILC